MTQSVTDIGPARLAAYALAIWPITAATRPAPLPRANAARLRPDGTRRRLRERSSGRGLGRMVSGAQA